MFRQVHDAGDKAFVDYAGAIMPVVDATTGDTREAQIFVGALGASHLIDAVATWTKALPVSETCPIAYWIEHPPLSAVTRSESFQC